MVIVYNLEIMEGWHEIVKKIVNNMLFNDILISAKIKSSQNACSDFACI